MRQRWNGSVQSSNTPTYDKQGITREDFGLYRCMIIDILYTDDEKNISKNSKNPEVLYEVVILGGHAMGQALSYCRLASYLDGSNYSERTLKKSTKDVSKVKLQDHDGDVVYVQFIQGHDAYPVIIAMARGITQKIGAKKADAPRFIESFNGFETLIDNKGHRTTTMKGGKTANGDFTAGDAAVITELWDAENEKTVKTYKSGLTITEDAKSDQIVITTSGGATATVDGKGNKVSIKAGSAEILIDGASGKISIKGDKVDLGTSVSDFVTLFTKLATAFNTHTHMVPQAPAGTLPSMPPMAPLLSTVGSQTVKTSS